MKGLLRDVGAKQLNTALEKKGFVLVHQKYILKNVNGHCGPMYLELLSKTAGTFMLGGKVDGHLHWAGLDCFRGATRWGGMSRGGTGQDGPGRDIAGQHGVGRGNGAGQDEVEGVGVTGQGGMGRGGVGWGRACRGGAGCGGMRARWGGAGAATPCCATCGAVLRRARRAAPRLLWRAGWIWGGMGWGGPFAFFSRV